MSRRGSAPTRDVGEEERFLPRTTPTPSLRGGTAGACAAGRGRAGSAHARRRLRGGTWVVGELGGVWGALGRTGPELGWGVSGVVGGRAGRLGRGGGELQEAGEMPSPPRWARWGGQRRAEGRRARPCPRCGPPLTPGTAGDCPQSGLRLVVRPEKTRA